MNNIFDKAQEFSKALKIAKLDYVSNGETSIIEDSKAFVESLKIVDLSILDNDQKKKAFWVNLYNGLTNYWMIKQGLKTNMKENPEFFKSYSVCVQDLEFSLDDIEHGLLRKNARHHLTANDQKLQYQVDVLDYRIHFALNCGATSCPPIAFYTSENIDEELNQAENSFVEHQFLVDHQAKEIKCSELFVWYKKDFEGVYLNNPKLKEYKIVTIPYDWTI